MSIAHHESGFNPYAAAGTTSATGLGQFTDGTGKRSNIKDSNRWDINAQADALVNHFLDNKLLTKKYRLAEAYIYKFHHDGPNSNYLNDSEGLQISYKAIMPKIKGYVHAIHKMFY